MIKRICLVLLLLWSPIVTWAGERTLTPGQVYRMLQEGSGIWLIDVRSESAFALAHIEGALNIPVLHLAGKNLPQRKQVVLIDNRLDSAQARQAVNDLQQRGYQRVYRLQGGLRGWREANLPMVGTDIDWQLHRLEPAEVDAVNDAAASRKVFDLRDAAERAAAPLATGEVPEGADLNSKLAQLWQLLPAVAGGKPQLESSSLVVVLPAAIDARQVYLQHFWPRPEPIVILEGAAVPRLQAGAKQTVISGDGCATCPGK